MCGLIIYFLFFYFCYLQVEFAAPVGYVEPERTKPQEQEPEVGSVG